MPRPPNKMTILQREIDEYVRLADLAEKAARYRDAVQAQVNATKLRAELRRISEVATAEKLTDPVARLRALGRIAASDGSWTSAERYAADAAKLEVERDDARAIRAQQNLEDQDPAELLQVIVSALDSMPREDVETILSACRDVLGVEDDTDDDDIDS